MKRLRNLYFSSLPKVFYQLMRYWIYTGGKRLSLSIVKTDPEVASLDDTDDFIQSHIDSHLPPSEEVIEEEREKIAEQARFLSSDPKVGRKANLYAYVGNNPVNKRDPSGMQGGPGGPPPSLIDSGGGGSGFHSPPCSNAPYETHNDCEIDNPDVYDPADYCDCVCEGVGCDDNKGYWEEVYDYMKQSWESCMGKCAIIGCVPVCVGVGLVSAVVGGLACGIGCATVGCAMICAAIH